MTESTTTLSKIREQIKPFSQTPRYPTGWGGEMTFEEIAESLSPLVTWKLQRYGMYGQDIPDSIQTGFMRLWERLVENPEFLAEDTRIRAMWRTFTLTKSTTLAKQNKKYVPFTDIEGDTDMSVEEYGILGYSSPSAWRKSKERWAVWTSEVDFRLDITEALANVAEAYMDDIKGLVALYILTTSVPSQAALEGHNLAHSMVYERMAEIRQQLQELLGEYAPIQPRTWRERLDAGEFEPYLEVVAHYHDKPLALFALYTLTTEAQVRKFARDEKERKMIIYYRKKCLKRIEAAYGRAASF